MHFSLHGLVFLRLSGMCSFCCCCVWIGYLTVRLGTSSMYFLLKKDGLVLAYFVLQVVIAFSVVLPFLKTEKPYTPVTSAAYAPAYTSSGSPRFLARVYVMVQRNYDPSSLAKKMSDLDCVCIAAIHRRFGGHSHYTNRDPASCSLPPYP